MNSSPPVARRALATGLFLAALACVPATAWFLVDGHLKIDLSDEGFLWYGTRALRDGLVPMRDFQAYDPGRYAWTAAWSFVLGEDLVALRLGCVLFGCLGVLAGLLAARRLSSHPLFLACVALTLGVWMAPRYKVFEAGIALVSVWAGTWLLEKPSLARHFWIGILGGIAAFFGRNHGAYHLLAFAALIGWEAYGAGAGTTARRVLAWIAGIGLGYLPQIVLWVCVDGYFDAWIESLALILQKGTNLPVPVPWPWISPGDWPFWPRASMFAIGCFFLAFPLFFVLAGLRISSLRRAGLAKNPLLIAAACLVAPYSHFVFSRADVVHLTHGAPVLVLGLLALGHSFPRAPAITRALHAPALLAASLLATLLWTSCAVQVAMFPDRFETVEVGGREMRVDRYDARVLAGARKLASDLARPDEPVFFAPNQPLLYPFTRRRSPTRQIYFIHPATPEEEADLVREIESSGVRWAMIRDYALDGRDDLRFANTHPSVARYLHENFAPVRIEELPPDEFVVRRPAGR